MTETLSSWVEARVPVGSEVGPADLEAWIEELGLPSNPRVQAAVSGAVREWGAAQGSLAWEPGGWKVKVTSPLVQGSISAALLWGILGAFQIATPIAAAVIPAIVPLLFSVEKVRLTRGEEEVLAHLALADRVRTETPEKLYQQLPASIREELGFLDFLDLVEKLVDAGRADRKDGEAIAIEPEGRARLRVVFE